MDSYSKKDVVLCILPYVSPTTVFLSFMVILHECVLMKTQVKTRGLYIFICGKNSANSGEVLTLEVNL